MSEQLTTRGGVRYRLVRRHKYCIESVALFRMPPRHPLDLDGRDSVRFSNPTRTATLALFTPLLVTLFPGFRYNGPDVVPDTENSMDSSMGHDAICDAMNAGLISPANYKAANALMYQEDRKHGMTACRARIRWRGVNAHWRRKAAGMDWPRV